jgi:hypothetical protein
VDFGPCSSFATATCTKMCQSGTHHGPSCGRHSLTDVYTGADSASMTENSLTGGGIRESSLLAGSVSGMQSITMRDAAERSDIADPQAYTGRGGARTRDRGMYRMGQPYHYGHHHHPMPHNADMNSVASMSLNSNGESLVSMPASIFSDISLSESLNALDLADPRLFDQI